MKKLPKPRMPWPILCMIIGIIAPIEFSPILGTLTLMPHRCAILIFIIPALIKVFSGKDIKWAHYDVLFVLYGCWVLFSFMMHLEMNAGLATGGSLMLECLGGYIIARAYIRSYDDFMATLNGLFYSICFVGLLALPEAVSGFHYVHIWLRGIGTVAVAANDEVRWGLHRSYATFNHPILYGAYCASLLSMIWFTETRPGTRLGKAVSLCVATFFGLSSAPLNTLVMQSLLGGIHRGTKRFPNRVKIFGIFLLIVYILLALFSDKSPIAQIVTRISIDPETAYYRTLIWGFGMDNVWANPWLGLGLDPWVRPAWMPSDSVDAYWLNVAMQMGLPAIILLIAAIWTLIARVHKRGPGQRPHQEQRAAIGWTLSFIAFTLAGMTVHYWNSTHTYLFFLLGMSGWLADPAPAKVAVKAKAGAKAKTARRLAPARPDWTHPPHPDLPLPEPAYVGHYVGALDPLAT